MGKLKKILSVLLVICLSMVTPLSNVGCVIVHAEANRVNGDAPGARSALETYLALVTSTTKEKLKASITTLQGYIQEDRRVDNGFSNAIAYLEN